MYGFISPALLVVKDTDTLAGLEDARCFPLHLVSVLRRGANAKKIDKGNSPLSFGLSFRKSIAPPLAELAKRKYDYHREWRSGDIKKTFSLSMTTRASNVDTMTLWFEAASTEEYDAWWLAIEKALRY